MAYRVDRREGGREVDVLVLEIDRGRKKNALGDTSISLRGERKKDESFWILT